MYKAAVIGLGRVGALFDMEDSLRAKPSSHCGALAGNPHVELEAVCDLDVDRLERVAKRWGVPYFYLDYRKMIALHGLDLVTVATPTETHEEIVVNLAMDKNRPNAIFVEKPIADSVVGARNMVKACDKAGVALVVNHSRRWHTGWREVAKLVEDGLIGQLLHMTMLFSGDIIHDGVHAADLVNFYNPQTYTAVNVETEYLIFEADMLGKKGRIICRENGRKFDVYVSEESKHYEGYKELRHHSKIKSTEKPTPMQLAIKNIVNVLDGKERLYCDGRMGVKALELAYSWMMEKWVKGEF